MDRWIDGVAQPIADEFLVGGGQDLRFVHLMEGLNVTETLHRTSSAIGYDKFEPIRIPNRFDPEASASSSFFRYTSKEEMGVNYTLQVLSDMGVNHSELVERGLLPEIPAWWQIIDNFGNEPVILGLERCAAFRQRVHRRHIAPAGMFSTGTNLLQQMLYDNCHSPLEGQRPRMFNLWQAPWGKHNPAAARLHHIANHQEQRNQSAVLPVVTVRHPFTWLYAVCVHPYALQWNHRLEFCDRSLFLKFPVKANWGALRTTPIANETIDSPAELEAAASAAFQTKEDPSKADLAQGPKLQHLYPSLMHVWRNWNADYLEQNEYPMLIVRFEDLVFRPREVVEQVCACAGGTVNHGDPKRYAKNKEKEEEPFWYLLEGANLGSGHGQHRSDLVSAMIKYGQPLEMYHNMYSELDWSIIRQVLQDDRGLMKALGYKS